MLETKVHFLPDDRGGVDPVLWQFAVSPRACVALERQTGKSTVKYIQDFADRRIERVYELAWALSASWRSRNRPELDYETCLDLWPAVESAEWPAFRDKLADLVSLAFFHRPWVELKALNESLEVLTPQEALEALLRARTEKLSPSTGEPGSTSDTESSDSATTSSGTSSESESSPS